MSETRALSLQRFSIGPGVATRFGCGAIATLPEAVSRLSPDGAFLVTDRGLVAAGVGGEVERTLREAGIETTVFDDVHANPDAETLSLGAEALRAARCGAVVALGGGSVLDAAKGMALMAPNPGPARDLDYRNEPAHPGLPIVAIPTTAGTGSETNGFGVIEDHAVKRKFYVGHASVVPRAVILDPDLTRGLPPGPTAATGIDVLAHALESLSSRRVNPYAEGLGLQVVGMVFRSLPRALADGQDVEARAEMLLAAHMAGLAFATTGLGLAHAVAHALSAHAGAAHGLALAVLLPHVLTFNLPVRDETYRRVARALGVSDDGAETAIAAVRNLVRGAGMPATLHELGCDEAMLPALIEDALDDDVIVNAPRVPNPEELQALLTAAL